MNYLDIILGIFLIIGLIRGFSNGLFVEIASLIALIAGIYGAIHFSHYASEFIADRFNWGESLINLVAFAATFIIIVLVISLAGKLLTKVADLAMLGILNKILGAIFGMLKTAFILSVIIMFLAAANNKIGFIDEETQEESIVYGYVKSLAPLVLPNILKDNPFKKDAEETEEPLNQSA